MEVKNIAHCVFMAPDPKLLTIDIAQIERNQAARRAEAEKNTPPPSKADLRKEYNQLRQRLFDCEQNAKAYEIRTNEAAGKVRLLEQRVNEAFKQKKAAAEAGNLRAEINYEHAIQTLESELLDAQDEFTKNKRYGLQAARALKEFNQHGRIAELKAHLEKPLPVAKSDTVPK
jgi:hypothetical protein